FIDRGDQRIDEVAVVRRIVARPTYVACVPHARLLGFRPRHGLRNPIEPSQVDVAKPWEGGGEYIWRPARGTRGGGREPDDVIEVPPHHPRAEDTVVGASLAERGVEVVAVRRHPPALAPHRHVAPPEVLLGVPSHRRTRKESAEQAATAPWCPADQVRKTRSHLTYS